MRLDEARIEVSGTKSEREKLYHKIDLLNEENSNLRNEVYMLKKLLLEYDRRDLHLTSAGLTQLANDHTPTRESLSKRGYDRPAEGLDSDQAQRGLRRSNASRVQVQTVAPEYSIQVAAKREFRSPPRNVQGQTNILTWNQPYEGNKIFHK